MTRIAIPVTIVAAGEERLVDNAALRRVAGRMPGARFVEIPGAYHEILQETRRVPGAVLGGVRQIGGTLTCSAVRSRSDR